MKKRTVKLLVFLLVLVCEVHGCGRRKSRKPRDNTPPKVICPDDIVQHADPGQVNAWIDWKKPVAIDTVDGEVSTYPCGRGPNERYSGTTYVTYRAQDRAGNTGKCTFKVHVYVITCDAPERIDNGYYQFYPSNDFRYGGIVVYGCYKGYQRVGHRLLECLADANKRDGLWSAPAPRCEKVKCSSEVLTGQIPHGYIHCTDQNRYQSKCTYTCKTGYRIKEGQAKVRVCGHRGFWLGRQPSCVDIKPPVIDNCPSSKIVYTDKGKVTATVSWVEPTATDNSGETIVVSLEGGRMDVPYSVGSHPFKYIAADSAGNKAKPCRFIISVRRLTCHTIYPTPGLLVTCEEGFGYGATCQFSCESSLRLEGKAEAECKRNGPVHLVRWSWGNDQPSCSGETCPALAPPVNGAVACDNWAHGQFCQMLCNKEFSVARTSLDSKLTALYACGNDGSWRPTSTLPGCTEERRGIALRKKYDLHYFSGDCCNENVRLEIQELFIQFLNEKHTSKCSRFGGECNVGNVRVTCGSDKCQSSNRKKRSDDNFDLYITGSIVYNSTGEKSSEEDYAAATEAMNEVAEGLGDVNMSTALNLTMELQSLVLHKTEVECEEGLQSTPYGFGCVGCEPGSYFNPESDKCELCPIGTYNDGSQITECMSCPPHTSTSTNGSESSDDCIDYCPPGKYSAYGTVPCTPCAMGSYTDMNSSTECTICPVGMTTSNEGTASSEGCQSYSISIVPSVNGSYGLLENVTNNGSDLFVSLKALVSPSESQEALLFIVDGYQEVFSMAFGHDVTFTVAGIETTVNGSVMIVDNWNTFSIHLSLGTSPSWKVTVNDEAFEEEIQVPMDPMSTFTVIIGSHFGTEESFEVTDLNIWSAVIEEDLRNATNSCSSPHYGDILSWNDVPLLAELNEAFLKVPTICDVWDHCTSSPCGNSTCIDDIHSFTCVCNPGLTGDLCDVDIDDCEFHACENDATCLDGVDTYSCACASGFTGEFCELQIVDGGWGEWSEWSPCTKSCNNGTQIRSRSCDQPLPGPDGADCSGESSENRACNEQECQTCSSLVEPEQGYVECEYNETSDMHTCTQHCDDGYAFSFEPLDYYVCGYNTGYVWNNVTGLQCTEIEAPSQVSLEHSVTYAMSCSEENVDAVQEMVTAKLEEVTCIQSGLCSLTSVNIVGNGCPVHVPEMTEVRVELVLSITLPEDILTDSVTGLDVLTGFSGKASEVADAITALYYMIGNGTFTVLSGGNEYSVTNQTIVPTITCQSTGYVWIDYYCVPCQVGTRGVDYTCYECPVGMYQDVPGQDGCVKCPTGLTTKYQGSKSRDDCSVPPTETDVCASFHMDDTDTEVGWLCGHTEVKVSRAYLTSDNFTDVLPSIRVYRTADSELLNECIDRNTDCVTSIDEQDLDIMNTYTVTGSVSSSHVTCSKTVIVAYTGLSTGGVVFVVFLVLIALGIVAAIGVASVLFYRSRKKVIPNKDPN